MSNGQTRKTGNNVAFDQTAGATSLINNQKKAFN